MTHIPAGEMSLSDHRWRLAKYAYFTGSPQGGSSDANKDSWKFYDGTKERLDLFVTSSSHLVVMAGPTVQESHSLTASTTSMKGVSKGDSLLLLCKLKGEARRFRIKFYGGEPEGATRCLEAVMCLQRYFPIKRMENDELTQDKNKTVELEGDVPMATLAKVALGELSASLPVVYSESHLPAEQLNTLIRLCLSDVTFPAFVAAVHKELTTITEDELN